MFDIMLTVCSHRAVSAATCSSIESLRLHSKLNYTWAFFTGDALIGRCRSLACSHFLEDTIIPYLLFIDDDIIFTPPDIEKIYQHLVNGYDVIGGIYPVKGASQMASYGWEGQLTIDGEVKEIEYLSTGFMGVSRRILAKVKDELKLPLLNATDWSRCYPFFECGRWEKRKSGYAIYISEDWDFCEKVRQVGGKVYADTSVQLGHIRDDIFTPKDVVDNQRKAAVQKQMFGSMQKQADELQHIDIDLSEYLHIGVEEVKQRINDAQSKMAELWRENPGEDFYRNNQESLFDLAGFNQQQGYYQTRLNGIMNLKGLKALDIGCGIGTLAFILADQGNEVIGWDISKPCIGFCNFRKSKNGTKVEFTTEMPELSQFDLVCAIDVLEHIEDLGGFLKMLGQSMKSGARFYHADCPKEFLFLNNNYPMHFDHTDNMDKWLREAQLIPWDDKWCVRV